MAEPEVQDHARRDLVLAVRSALAQEGHLLTAGEQVVLLRFLALPDTAASLYARLFARKPTVFRIDKLQYAEVPDINQAVTCLMSAGLVDDQHCMSVEMLLAVQTVVELRAVCSRLELPSKGSRQKLLDRLGMCSPTAVSIPAISLRHKKLFRRMCRCFLHDHTGDLSVMVLTRMGQIKFPDYTTTDGGGLFPHRMGMLRYEQLRRMRMTCDAADIMDELPKLLAILKQHPALPDHRYRFSAHRYAGELIFVAARHLERKKQTKDAATLYADLLEHSPRLAAAAGRRLALCNETNGAFAEAVHACTVGMEKASEAERIGLDRTGRRLARKAHLRWTPLAPLSTPPIREIRLEGATWSGHRPAYATSKGAAPVERALCIHISQLGRRAFFGEAAPWSTLFALLCHGAIFAPIAGMLPTSMMFRPLDFGTKAFGPRRKHLFAPIFEHIRRGEGPALLRKALHELDGVHVQGLRWDRFGPQQLMELVEGIDGTSLSGILQCFATDPWRARQGLPDLCILPGPECSLPNAIPGKLPSGLLLAEVKGPGDTIRDEQRIWMDRLLSLNVRVEVWKVSRSAPSTADALKRETNRRKP